jgi:hypothetical protein
MKFLELLRLELVHDYYPDRRCPDFQIEPTAATQTLLKNCRAVIKPVPGGIRLLVPASDEDLPFIPLPAKPVFAFHLRLENPDFVLFTDLAEINATTAPLYTNSNPGKSGNLHLTSREAWSTESFVVQQPARKEPFVLAGRPSPDLKTAGAFAIKGLGRTPGHKRYDEDARTINVNTSAAEAGRAFTVTYPVVARLDRDVFADVEIKYDDSPATPEQSANPFQIAFKSKEARWKYYVITDKATNKAGALTLEDKDKDVVFKLEDRVDLTKTPDPADAIAGDLAKRYPGMQYFRFVSSTLVPCQKAARKGIQLQLDGDKVIDALPNPVLQNYTLDTRNATTEYTLYHIVKYFTH